MLLVEIFSGIASPLVTSGVFSDVGWRNIVGVWMSVRSALRCARVVDRNFGVCAGLRVAADQ